MGDVTCSQTIIVGDTGCIDANTIADSLWVMGKVKGTVKVKKRIVLAAGGSIEGEINTPHFIVEEGGVFNGTCVIIPEEKEEEIEAPSLTTQLNASITKPVAVVEFENTNSSELRETEENDYQEGLITEISTLNLNQRNFN